jgi:hypothetical protein
MVFGKVEFAPPIRLIMAAFDFSFNTAYHKQAGNTTDFS